MLDAEELRLLVAFLGHRAEVTEDPERQRKLLGIATKWEATADESDGE